MEKKDNSDLLGKPTIKRKENYGILHNGSETLIFGQNYGKK